MVAFLEIIFVCVVVLAVLVTLGERTAHQREKADSAITFVAGVILSPVLLTVWLLCFVVRTPFFPFYAVQRRYVEKKGWPDMSLYLKFLIGEHSEGKTA